MRIYADLHIHGKFSRAVSKDMLIPNLERAALEKGINLLGTGDAQHPGWNAHVKEHLVKEKEGIYYTRSGFPFILSTEIALVYTKRGKGRRVHLVLLFPSFKTVEDVTRYLLGKGRIDYDGRPIFRIDCEDFAHAMKGIDERIEIIPAHIWTPWFSLFGSKSGFDRIEDCFGKETLHIHALETGLSSDPPMNWRLSQLDPFVLVSFSDAHSHHPWRIGREATIFDIDLSYASLILALRTRKGYVGTIEVDPAYGKYHFDGHRKCGVSLDPAEKMGGECPSCKESLTIGVLHRVEELADRPYGFVPEDAGKFFRLLPLHELIAFSLKKGVSSKAVQESYRRLLDAGKDEFHILLEMDERALSKAATPGLVRLVLDNRKGCLDVIPGYDGVYGVLK